MSEYKFRISCSHYNHPTNVHNFFYSWVLAHETNFATLSLWKNGIDGRINTEVDYRDRSLTIHECLTSPCPPDSFTYENTVNHQFITVKSLNHYRRLKPRTNTEIMEKLLIILNKEKHRVKSYLGYEAYCQFMSLPYKSLMKPMTNNDLSSSW